VSGLARVYDHEFVQLKSAAYVSEGKKDAFAVLISHAEHGLGLGKAQLGQWTQFFQGRRIVAALIGFLRRNLR
jgi:hypothetical protein